MTKKSPYLPVFELTRGEAVESVHFGAFAVVNSHGNLVANYGDPNGTSFLRSSAKPFQALPLVEKGGLSKWNFTKQELAILCASHTGTDQHFNILNSIQAKIEVTEDDLLCGVHPAIDRITWDAMYRQNEKPTPNRHNCSGKHTGMLAMAKIIQSTKEDYIGFDHPIQKEILATFCDMCSVKAEETLLGIDGCSAPVFAIPFQNAALGYARLCDPWDLTSKRAEACKTITDAMMSHPDMVSGPGRFDTCLMETASGKIISKGGAEGYQQVGIMPGVLEPGSPGLGIAIKISDGDSLNRVRPAVVLEILHQLGAITPQELAALSNFGPVLPVKNWRKLTVGKAYPVFKLQINSREVP